jgi:hypothetical protein
MRITAIADIVVPISSSIRYAYFDFSQMTASNESYPQVFAPFGGFADTCAVKDSRVPMPEIPGIGFEAKNALYAVMKPLLAVRPN